MASKAKQTSRVNKKWFQSSIASAGLSQAEVARRLKVDPSAVSLFLDGVRRLRIDEAASLSILLSVPIEDVLFHAGILSVRTSDEDAATASRETLRVSGTIDERLEVQWEKPKSGVVSAPKPAFAAGKKLRVLAAKGAPGIDSGLVYVNKFSGVDESCVGHLSVVNVVGQKSWWLRVVKKGHAAGLYTLTDMAGKISKGQEDVQLENACPVVWIKLS